MPFSFFFHECCSLIHGYHSTIFFHCRLYMQYMHLPIPKAVLPASACRLVRSLVIVFLFPLLVLVLSHARTFAFTKCRTCYMHRRNFFSFLSLGSICKLHFTVPALRKKQNDISFLSTQCRWHQRPEQHHISKVAPSGTLAKSSRRIVYTCS